MSTLNLRKWLEAALGKAIMSLEYENIYWLDFQISVCKARDFGRRFEQSEFTQVSYELSGIPKHSDVSVSKDTVQYDWQKIITMIKKSSIK